MKKKKKKTNYEIDDVFMTPRSVADSLVDYFKPEGICMEPCRGSVNGSFYQSMLHAPNACRVDWCEITEGRDFFKCHTSVDWIITNPPWRKLWRPFMLHSMEIADNIVFLTAINQFWTRARLRDIATFQFALRKIVCIPTARTFPWPNTGFQIGAVYLQRGVQGKIDYVSEEQFKQVYAFSDDE